MKYHGYIIEKEHKPICGLCYVVYCEQLDGTMRQMYWEEAPLFGGNMNHVKMMIDVRFGRL